MGNPYLYTQKCQKKPVNMEKEAYEHCLTCDMGASVKIELFTRKNRPTNEQKNPV